MIIEVLSGREGGEVAYVAHAVSSLSLNRAKKPLFYTVMLEPLHFFIVHLLGGVAVRGRSHEMQQHKSFFGVCFLASSTSSSVIYFKGKAQIARAR